MEKNRVCKICNRLFANGKAMGGHMRSHLAKLKIPNIQNSPPSSSMGSKPHYEIESDSESPRRKRSKRLVTDEDAAATVLLMMSKDNNWINIPQPKQVVLLKYENEYEDDEDSVLPRTRRYGKYKCNSCNKVFRSYQALGGHRASHKKKEDGELGMAARPLININNGDHRRMFECPFCDKVFESGQALGGHKKVHFSYLIPAATNSNARLLQDLNQPAPAPALENQY